MITTRYFSWMQIAGLLSLVWVLPISAQTYTLQDITTVVRAIYEVQSDPVLTLSTGERIDLNEMHATVLLSQMLGQSSRNHRHLDALMQRYGISKTALDEEDYLGDGSGEPEEGDAPKKYFYYQSRKANGSRGHFRFYYTLNGDDAVPDPCQDTIIKMTLPDGSKQHTSAGEDASTCNDYDLDNAPDYVERIGIYLEYSLRKFLEMGFTDDVLDAPVLNPESGKVVYIEQMSGGTRGWTCNGCSIHLRNTLSAAQERYVGAHELFHQVQLTYAPVYDGWVIEGTARWAEDAVYDDDMGSTGTVNAYLHNPQPGLKTKSYEAVLFWKYFAEHFGHVKQEPEIGVDAIATLWQTLATYEPEDAIDEVLRRQGFAHLDFYDVFSDYFAPANYVLQRAASIPPALAYTEEALYRPVRLINEDHTTLQPDVPWVFSDSTIEAYGLDYYGVSGLWGLEEVHVQVIAGAPIATTLASLYNAPTSGAAIDLEKLDWQPSPQLVAEYPHYQMQGAWGRVYAASAVLPVQSGTMAEIGIIMASARELDYTLLVNGVASPVVSGGGVLGGPRGKDRGREVAEHRSDIALNGQASGLEQPQRLELGAAYPNPFTEQATLVYATAEATHVSVDIYDMLGRHVAVLVNQHQEAGRHHVVWNGADAAGEAVAPGTYVAILKAGSQKQSQVLHRVR